MGIQKSRSCSCKQRRAARIFDTILAWWCIRKTTSSQQIRIRGETPKKCWHRSIAARTRRVRSTGSWACFRRASRTCWVTCWTASERSEFQAMKMWWTSWPVPNLAVIKLLSTKNYISLINIKVPRRIGIEMWNNYWSIGIIRTRGKGACLGQAQLPLIWHLSMTGIWQIRHRICAVMFQ